MQTHTHTERHIHSMRNYTASERCSSWGLFVWGPVNGHKCCSQQQNNASFGINVVGTRASHGLAIFVLCANFYPFWILIMDLLLRSPTCFGNLTQFQALFLLHLLALLQLFFFIFFG